MFKRDLSEEVFECAKNVDGATRILYGHACFLKIDILTSLVAKLILTKIDFKETLLALK